MCVVVWESLGSTFLGVAHESSSSSSNSSIRVWYLVFDARFVCFLLFIALVVVMTRVSLFWNIRLVYLTLMYVSMIFFWRVFPLFFANQGWGNHVCSCSSQIRGFSLSMIWPSVWNLGHGWLQLTASQSSFKFGTRYVCTFPHVKILEWMMPVLFVCGLMISMSQLLIMGFKSLTWWSEFCIAHYALSFCSSGSYSLVCWIVAGDWNLCSLTNPEKQMSVSCFVWDMWFAAKAWLGVSSSYKAPNKGYCLLLEV